jgi:signal transduction histidine kinase/DNA-binding NarL/FixJ family response regulator
MSKSRILIVEDDPETADYLKTNFDRRDYEVLLTGRGDEAVTLCRSKLPSAVILDIILPDLSGFEVCRRLRRNSRTSYVPIIFLSYRNRRNDIVAAFEAGADDYMMKPFDIEELRLRVDSAIRYSRQGSSMHPVTNLPAGELISEQLKAIKDSARPWALLYFDIANLGVFRAVSTAQTVDDTLLHLADIMRETVEHFGTPQDFIGHVSDDGFLIITTPESAGEICTTVTDQFNAEGLAVGQTTGLLKLEVNVVSSYDGPFADIRQIAKTLAERRLERRDVVECPGLFFGAHAYDSDVDYYHQLQEQVLLWDSAPELAQVLLETERLVMTKLPDLNRLKLLFNLVDLTGLSPVTQAELDIRRQLAFLASENLLQLLLKTRPYQPAKPVPLRQNLEQIAGLWPTVQFTDPQDGSELQVPLPQEKVQQLLHNICKWLWPDRPTADDLAISLRATDEKVSLLFAGVEPPNIPTLFDDLYRNKRGAVYGYLAHKLAVRYGGRLELNEGQLMLTLPLAKPEQTVKTDLEPGELRRNIRKHRLFLDHQDRGNADAQVFDKAAQLVDPLAEDLLAEIEGMLALVSARRGIDPNAHPWSTIRHNLRFFRILVLELQRNRPLIPAPVNLKSLIESVTPLITHQLLGHDIVIECDTERPVVNTDQTRLQQILVNLALNALEAMPDGGVLMFNIKGGDYYEVEVVDNGRGIAPNILPHIFDPHFSTKGSGRGAGLYNVKLYVAQLHGQIEVSSEIGRGTTVTVKLPPSWGAGYF